MRFLLTSAIVVLFSVSSIAQWTQLTPDGYSTYEAYHSVIKFHPASYEPYVMFQDIQVNETSTIKMRRFDGAEWQIVGSEIMETLVNFNDHVAFDFDPVNANIPIAYFQTGNQAGVVSQSGNAWEPYLGLDNFYIDEDIGFDFDLDNVGNPTIAYGSPDCEIPDLLINGALNVLIHNSQEWGYLVAPCQSAMPATNPNLEYNDFDDKLMVFHSGGPDPDEDYIGERWLLDYNVSTTSPLAVVEFISVTSIGRMTTNPVTGDTYVYAVEPPTVGSPDRVLTLMRWDGTELTTIDTQNILIKQASLLLKVHPISGEIYVVYRDADNWTGFEYEWNVKRLEGTNWVEPYSNMATLENFEAIDFAFHPVTGDIYIAVQMFIDGPLRGAVITHSQPTDLPELTNELNLDIYPNPATDQISLNMGGFIGSYTTQVYSLDGRSVIEQRMNNQDHHQIDIKELASGSYLLRCTGDFGQVERSFVKE